jgi:hypothetical protein
MLRNRIYSIRVFLAFILVQLKMELDRYETVMDVVVCPVCGFKKLGEFTYA